MIQDNKQIARRKHDTIPYTLQFTINIILDDKRELDNNHNGRLYKALQVEKL